MKLVTYAHRKLIQSVRHHKPQRKHKGDHIAPLRLQVSCVRLPEMQQHSEPRGKQHREREKAVPP